MDRSSRDEKRIDETGSHSQKETKQQPRTQFLSPTTIIVICTVVPLLLSGFLNHFAHKTWILYFPLAGIVLAVLYFGHLGIRSITTENKEQPRVAPSDRPWLAVDIQVTGPLSFDNNGASLPLRYIITNGGHSPANNVAVKADVLFPKFGADFVREPIKRQKEICGQRMGIPFGGTTVFPGRPVVIPISHGMNMDAMKAQFDTEEMRKAGSAGKIAAPYLVGCVSYNFGDPSFSGETGFICQIQRRRENPNVTFNLRIGEDVPVDQLILVNLSFGGDYAK